MKKNIFSKVSVILLIGIMVFSLAACSTKSGSTATGSNTEVDKIKKAGVLVVGTSGDYPPYEFHKQVNGKDEIVGFDMEIAKQIAKDLGVKLEVKDITFNGLLEALNTNKIDMVIAGMNPTAERAKAVDFSKIYYKAVQTVLIRTEDKDKYKALADLKGMKVGVQMGSVQEQLANDQMKGSTKKSLGKITDLVLELKNKKIDALVIEKPVADSYAAKNPDLFVTDMKFANAEDMGSAIAVRKNSPALVKAINNTIDKLVKNKTIDKLVIDANNMTE